MKTNGWAHRLKVLLTVLALLLPVAAFAAQGPKAVKAVKAGKAKKGADREFADVTNAVALQIKPGYYRFNVTISSPDTGWRKYANAFRVRLPGGKILGVRTLYHPHVNEQPFTRSLLGVRIPPGVGEVVVEARDSVAGWGGKRVGVKIRP